MQKIIKRLFALSLFVALCVGCKKEEQKILVTNISAKQADVNSVITVATDGVVILDVEVLPESATRKSVRYESDNIDVFSVTPQGIVYGVAIGQANLSIRSVDGSGVIATYIVDVVKEDIKITQLNLPSSIDLSLNTFNDLSSQISFVPINATNKRLEYTSMDPNIVSIGEEGVMKGLAVGMATIIVSTTDNSNITETVTVEVKDIAVSSIELKTTSKKIKKGDKFDLASQVVVLPINAGNKRVTYFSDNNDAATVTAEGQVEGKGKGVANIIVTTENGGFTAQCEIIVTDELINRTAWTATASHGWVIEANVCFEYPALFDGNLDTNVGVVKAGKTAVGITVPAGDKVFITIDMKRENEFDYILYRHRTSAGPNVRATEISLYGSNAGTADADFVPIKEKMKVNNNITEVKLMLDKVEKYRYVRLLFEAWAPEGNTIQLSEFNLGLTDE